MTKITIEWLDPALSTPLYHRYQGQYDPQDAFIELDLQSGKLSADYSREIGNAVPIAVWHGSVQRYSIPAGAFADSINDALADITGFCEEVLNGYTEQWEGTGWTARLDAAAREVKETIEHFLDAYDWDCAAVIESWSDWYDMNLDSLLEDLNAAKSADDFDKLARENICADGHIDDVDNHAGEWIVGYIDEIVEDVTKDQLPGWLLADEYVQNLFAE